MRKSFITFALTLALLLVSVGIKAQTPTVYLDIDFEDCSTGSGNVPTGWNNQDFTQGTSTSTSMNSYLWYVSSSTTAGYSHSGTQYAYLYAYNTYTSASRLKTPAMTLSSTKTAKVSFWLRNYKSTSASYQFGDFSLYVSTDGGTTYTQNPVVQHVYSGQEWTYYEYSLDNFKGQTINLVFEGASSGATTPYAYYYLDDIKVEEAPTCQKPKDAYINNLTGTSATFNWSLDNKFGVVPAQYSVTLKDEAGTVVYHNAAELASGVNFSNLQPNTTYTASVMSDCSAAYQGKSDSVSISFTTLPTAINPPLVENFDSMADFADGYYVKNATINTTASYSYGNAGKSVKLTTTATDDAYIIFPLMNIVANNIEVDFMMRRAAAATATIGAIPYQVGYLTDPSDVSSTFVPVLQDNIDGDATWRNIRFNTASVPDVTTPVMVCLNISAAYATSVYVDEVSIHVIPTCTRPEHVTCSNITDQSVTISWDMANATSCVVRAMSLADSIVISQVATQNPYIFTGLTQNTEYEFTVQGACSATDSSEVTRPVTAKTECSVAESAIFLENFDNLGTQPIPDCWKMDWIVKPSNNTKTAPFATGTTKHSGTKGMSLVDQQAGSISYLSTGALPFDVAGKYNFSIWVNRATYSTAMKYDEGIQIWITNAPGDTVGGTMLAYIHREPSLTPVDNAGWHQYEYNIPVQGNKYVTIVGISEYGAATWFDDVEVMLAPSCPKVTGISLADVAATSADVAWTAGDDETQWVVNYTLKMGTAIVLDTTFIADTAAFSVEGLTPATNYTVMGSVRALCGVGDTAEAVSFNFPFKTQCLPMALLPYTYGFEDDATGTSAAFPECWSRYNDASGTYNYYPYVYSSTTYFHSGSKGLYFYTTTTSTYAEHQMAILPAIDVTAHPINTLRIKFWAKRSTTTSYADAPMIIGVMSNPTDLNSFVAVDTVVVSNSSDQQEYIVLLDQYVGNGANIAIRLDRQSTTCYCYVDDITVEPIPSCQDIEGSATVSDNTESSVKITLDDQTATTAWSFAYGPAGTHVAEMTAYDTTGAAIVLNNLTSATNYDLYVRRNCGNGDYSPWSSVVKFSTTAVPATIPYICGFEDAAENGQWQFSQGNNANNFVVGTVSTAVHAGTQSMYVSADNGETNAYTGTSSRNYAYRTINFGAKGYQIEYYWRCAGGEGTTTIYDYGRVMLLPVSESIVGGAGTSITSSNQQAGFPTNAIMLNPEEKGYMSLDGTDWHFESFFVNMSATPGNYNLVLAWNNDGSGGTTAGPLAIDDISITELTCIPPISIQTSAVTATSATLSVSQATASEWEFIVDTVAFTKDAAPAAPFMRISSTDGTATLANLTPNTEYFYSVRTICGVGDTSAWLAPSSLRTYCSAYDVPYTEGFENVAAANCWSMMADESGEASVERATTYHKSGTASLKGVKASIISPEFNVDSLTHYMITGWVYSTVDSAQFGVGIIVDPNDASSYENISNVLIPAKNTWTEFTAYFTALADPDYEDFKYAKNIVLACGGENTLYFDDIMVDLTPTCPKPNEVAITNITAHSFDISFVDNASASQWVVYTNGTPNVITTNPATISNLTASMNYAVSIAAVCSATDTSYVTDCGTIRTLCDKTSTPWVCGFESSEGYVGGTSYNAETTGDFNVGCWTIFNQKPGGATYPYAYVSTSSTYTHSGSQGVYTYTSSSATKNFYMMLPDLTDPSNMLRINVWYKNAGGTTASYADLEFGYWTDPTADTSFVTVYTFPKSSSTTTWTEGEIMTNNASYNIPANARIGFMIDRNSTGYGLYLDDISVNLIRNCSDPATPEVSDITSASAKVTFTDTCATHAAWEYVYGPMGFDPNTATPVSIDTTVFTLTGLTDDSNYDVYVRAVCGVGDVSNYVPASFKTLCLPFHVTATTPFFEDFNNYNYGQFMNTGTCYTVIGEDLTASNLYWAKAYPASEPSATATTFYFYGHSADRYDRSFYWNLYKTYLEEGTMLRQFHLDAGTTYEMSAWVRNSTTTSYSTLVSAMIGETADDLDTLSSLVVDGETKSSRSIDGHTTYPYNELYKEIKAFITPDSTGDYYIGFNAKINNTSTSTYLYLDDWSIKTFTGVAPKIPDIDSVTTNAAYISVNDTDYYQFEYVLNDTTLATTVVDTNVFVINGLSPSTTYTLYMRKYGDATTYSEWISVPFATECGAITEFPYTQGFEGDFPPACWGQFTYGTPDHVWASTTSSTYVHSGSKAASIADKTAGAKTVLTSGEFNLTSPDGYFVRFWIYRAASSSFADKVDEALHVGYYNAPITANNINSVNEIGVINRNVANAPAESSTAAGYYMYEFEVPAGVLGSVWFSFDYHNQYGGGIYLDDITIEPIPSCATPKDAPVVASTTMTTATVTVNMKNKSLAEIAWVLPANTDSIIGSVNTTTGTAIATDLNGSTTYRFMYRFICAEGDTSAWSPMGNGTTMASDCFAPQNVRTVGMLNDHHAAITWGKAPEAVAYEYILKQGNNVVDSAVNMNDTIVYDSLAANTIYVFQVRALCADDTSAWITLNIQTTYPTFQLPFICGFENAEQNNGWQMRRLSTSGDNQYVIGNGTSYSGQNALYVSDDNSTYNYASGATVSDAEVLLEIPAGNYYVSYDWNCNGEGTTTIYDYGRVFLAPSNTTIAGTSYTAFNTSLPTGAISLDGGHPLNKATDWTNYTEIVTIPDDNVYKLVVLWANDALAYQPPFAIDNIRIEEVSCMPVTSVNINAVYPTSAEAVITPYADSVTVEYALSIYDTEDSVSTWTVATGDTILFDHLATGTAYTLFARHACSATEKSPVKMVSFLTPNNSVQLPFVATFEANDTLNQHWTMTSGQALNWYTIGSATSAAGSKSMYVTDDGSSHHYSCQTSNLVNSYAYIPIQFPAGSFDVTYQWYCHGESTFDYGHLFLVPSSVIPEDNVLMTGMSGSAVPTGAISLDGTLTKLNSTDSLNDVWFDVATELVLENAGTYNLVVAWHNDGSVTHQPPFAVDNIKIKQLTCPKPVIEDMSIDSSSTDMIRLKISGMTPGKGIIYHVASDNSYTDTIASGVVYDSLVTLTGLSASTWYFARVSYVCAVGDTSSVLSIRFRTNCGITTQFPYVEDFESYVASSTEKTQLDDNCWLTSSTSTSAYYYMTTTGSYVHSGSKALYIYNYSTSGTIQTFGMPKVDTLAGKRLSMWFKNYSTTSTYAKLEVGYLSNPDNTNSFVLLQSVPHNTAYSEFVMTYPANVPVGARPAFRANGTYYLYIDDIRLNKLVQGPAYEETLCFGQGYSGHGFSCAPGSLAPGDTTLTTVVPAVIAGTPDTAMSVTLHVLPEIVTEYHDTICAGQPYNEGLFNIPANMTHLGYFFQTFPGASSTGCDSTVSLYLYVLPSHETINDTICQGDVYPFDGQNLTQSGTYVAYTVNRLGCNDTITLNLFVVDSVVTTNAAICQGETYTFEGNNYTQSGTYRVTTTGAFGCPVTKVLNLTVYDTDSTIYVTFCTGGSVFVVDTTITTAGTYTLVRVNATGCDVTYTIIATETTPTPADYYDFACEGYTYVGYGITVTVTADTTVIVNTKTVDAQCDSVARIHLTFVATQRTDTTAEVYAESFTWHNNTYTVSGDYTDTLQSVEGCDSIVTLHLILHGDDVEEVSDINMSIVPNPVNAGATAFVYGEFDEIEKVEILNNFGQLVESFVPETYPIEVTGISASGLYYVRVITKTGNVYLQKLMVK